MAAQKRTIVLLVGLSTVILMAILNIVPIWGGNDTYTSYGWPYSIVVYNVNNGYSLIRGVGGIFLNVVTIAVVTMFSMFLGYWFSGGHPPDLIPRFHRSSLIVFAVGCVVFGFALTRGTIRLIMHPVPNALYLYSPYIALVVELLISIVLSFALAGLWQYCIGRTKN